jgi:glyoxylase-like metal-dependent hydrolase (beta-lactamase superfamily II)
VEDHLDPFFGSNVWHVRGRERDLVVDTGNGIGDLRGELEPSADDRPIVAVATHHHFDHIGGLPAFDEPWCHAAGGRRGLHGLADPAEEASGGARLSAIPGRSVERSSEP